MAAHGSRHYRNEKMRDKEQPMVAISTGASVRSHHCGRSNYHPVMLSFAKELLRIIWDDHWDDVGMRHWDDDWEGDDWGDHWDAMMMMVMNRMITVIGMMMMTMMMLMMVMVMVMMMMMMVIVVVMVMVMG